MKKYLGILSSIALFSTVNAQTPAENKMAVKLYNLSSINKTGPVVQTIDTLGNTHSFSQKAFDILHASFAFQWKTKKGNYHEIELTSFELQRDKAHTEIKNTITGFTGINGGHDLQTSDISLRYEYIRNLTKKEGTFVPSVGLGFNPYFRQAKLHPVTSNVFKTTQTVAGVRVFITPRFTYHVSEKLFFDVNIPFCINDVHYMTDKIENPATPLLYRSVSALNFETIPQFYSARIGVGLKI